MEIDRKHHQSSQIPIMAETTAAQAVDAWRQLDRALRMNEAEGLTCWSERKDDY